MCSILRIILTALALGLAAGTVAQTPSTGQAYPTRPIRLVVPYPPGGGTDFFARLVGAKMAEGLGQQIIVDNRPGASTIVGAEAVAKAPPDGYTLLLGDTATYSVNPSLFAKLPYDPLRDFEPVTRTVQAALLLVVNADSPINSVKDLIDRARAKPGVLNYGSPGPGTPHHLAMELLSQATGAKLTHIPYKGAAPAVQELLSGRLDVMFLDLGTGGPQVRSGKLKALAVGNRARLAALPDVPTVAEAGVPGFEAFAWQGFALPARTPREIVTRISAEYMKALADPGVRQKLIEVGFDPTPSTPEELTAFIRAEQNKWAKVIKEGGIKVE